MTYNFDTLVDRRNTSCIKWDACPSADVLPLWVADMDFPAAPCIQQALRERVEHGVYGYARVPDSCNAALQWWYESRHQWHIEPEQVLYTIGVVPALSAIVQALTQPGDRVLLQSPVYNCFFSSIRNAGCEIVDSPLIYENQTYRMDYADLEQKLADPQLKLMLLCNPHNPAGRVWSAEELRRVGELCERHGVFVISDEIHNGIIMPGHHYTPYATLGFEHWAVCVSPSKSFNTAGLRTSAIVAPDADVRARIDKQININEICDHNPFGLVAFEAAYSPEGAEWLDLLNQYIHGNYQLLRSFLAQHLPQLPVTELEGTYLAWVECSALGFADAQELEKEILGKARVWFNAGTMYAPQGSQFLRINLACPRSILEEALNRFLAYVRDNLLK